MSSDKRRSKLKARLLVPLRRQQKRRRRETLGSQLFAAQILSQFRSTDLHHQIKPRDLARSGLDQLEEHHQRWPLGPELADRQEEVQVDYKGQLLVLEDQARLAGFLDHVSVRTKRVSICANIRLQLAEVLLDFPVVADLVGLVSDSRPQDMLIY